MCSTGTCWWSSERDDRNMREMTRKNRSLHGSSDPELRFCSRFCRIVRIGTNRIVAWLSRARDNCLVVAIGTLARYRAFSRSRSGAVGHNAVATRVPGRVVGPGSQISNAKARLSLQQHANAEKTLTMTVCAQHVWLFVHTDTREFRSYTSCFRRKQNSATHSPCDRGP